MCEKVRLAELEDMPELLRMGREFHSASGYSDFCEFGEDELRATMKTLIESKCCLIANGGMVGFIVFPMYVAKNCLMSQELFWWVDEDKRGTRLGLSLLKEMELISKEKGAKIMNMISLDGLNGDKVSSLYKKLGYECKEHSFMKEL